eukprot:2904613-Amphidinium_carterae.2
MSISPSQVKICFSLFYLPTSWKSYSDFEKPVPKSILAAPPREYTYVAIQTIPMGWSGAVDVIHCPAHYVRSCGNQPLLGIC